MRTVATIMLAMFLGGTSISSLFFDVTLPGWVEIVNPLIIIYLLVDIVLERRKKKLKK